jgi:hypothetical protein
LPAGSYAPAAGNPDDPPPYRPGSTSDYLPRGRSGGGDSGSRSMTPSLDSGVRAAGYAEPAASTKIY